MQKLNSLLIILFLLVNSGIYAQEDGYILKTTFQPESVYKSRVLTNSSMMMKMDSVDIPGMASTPIVMEQTMHSTISTGAKNDEGKYSILVVFDSTKVKSMMAGEPIKISEMKMEGWIKDGKIELGPMEGEDVPPQLSELSSKTFFDNYRNYDFPERPIKIGETFTVETPAEGPITTGLNMKANTVIHYTLRKIKGDIAFLDTEYDFDMEADQEGQVMEGSGGGKGKVLFNFKEGYAMSDENEMTFTINMAMGDQKMKMTTTVIAVKTTRKMK